MDPFLHSLSTCEDAREELAHPRLRAQHRHLRISADVRAKRGARRSIPETPIAPALLNILSLVKRKPDGKAAPAKEQSRAWTKARDAFAEENRDLARSAARKQWQRNRHLTRERIYDGLDASGKLRYRLCQPDLEDLAYMGLLEAIRCFDSSKAHCISSYAVHTMKQSMMTLLRQTPVFYPQELLRDRRELAAAAKKILKTEQRPMTWHEQDAVLMTIKRPKPFGPLTREQQEDLDTRLQLAINCYYGQEHKSTEDLQERYVERSDRSEKRARRNKTIMHEMSVQPVAEYAESDEKHDLAGAVAKLPVGQRAAVEQYLRGRGTMPQEALGLLREAML